ncbi:MAG: tetratricopeptide repeat protein [Bernardetiaceae bacterium]
MRVFLLVMLLVWGAGAFAQVSDLKKGMEAHQKEDFSAAIQHYNRHLVDYPEDARGFYWRGLAYIHLERHASAVRDLEKAVRLNLPQRADASYWKGQAQYRTKDYEGAAKSFGEALRYDFADPAYPHQWRGYAYFQIQDYAQAIPDLRAALQKNHPDQADIHQHLGQIYEQLKDFQLAIHHYGEALKQPNCPKRTEITAQLRSLQATMRSLRGDFLWIEPLTAVSESREADLDIEACLNTLGQPLEYVQILIDGRAKYRLLKSDLPYASAAGCERSLKQRIHLQPGQNTITLRAVTTAGEFVSEERVVMYEPRVSLTDRPRVWAMIVGVAAYTHARSLRYSDDDAYRMYAFLKSPEGGALPESQISLLIDENATRQNILQQMQALFAKAARNDLVMLYFSGHGLPGSFVPFDYNGAPQTLLPHQEIQRIFRQTQARNRLCIADACHSGSLDKGEKSGNITELTNRYYDALLESDGGMALLMSSKAEENSIEYQGLRQGVFSHFLIRGLGGEADTDHDGVIRITELYRFVQARTKAYTGYRQNPELHGIYDQRMPIAVVRP